MAEYGYVSARIGWEFLSPITFNKKNISPIFDRIIVVPALYSLCHFHSVGW